MRGFESHIDYKRKSQGPMSVTRAFEIILHDSLNNTGICRGSLKELLLTEISQWLMRKSCFKNFLMLSLEWFE